MPNDRADCPDVRASILIADHPVNYPIQHALDLIAGVHCDGFLSTIPAVRTGNKVEAYLYRHHKTGKALMIGLGIGAQYPEFEFVRGFGSFLDYEALGVRNVHASERSPHLASWRIAVDHSFEVRLLKYFAGQEEAEVFLPSSRIKMTVNQKLILDNIEYPELFARSYAQYIAACCPGSVPMEQLNSIRADPLSQVYAWQWDDKEFQPIAEAIDGALRRKGWL